MKILNMTAVLGGNTGTKEYPQRHILGRRVVKEVYSPYTNGPWQKEDDDKCRYSSTNREDVLSAK